MKIKNIRLVPPVAHYLHNHFKLFTCILLLLLIATDFLCYQQALPIELDIKNAGVTLHVGSEVLPLGVLGQPVALQFAPHDPVIHEYQLDGTDSTNNFTLDQTYLDGIASSPYYRFQAWIRNLDGTSRWSDLRIYKDDRLLTSVGWPANGSSVSIPSVSELSSTQTLRLRLALNRPETPMSFSLLMSNNTNIQITLNRNDRKIEVTHQTLASNDTIATSFFPIDPLPFAAMVLDTILRILIAAILILWIVLVAEIVLGWLSLNILFILKKQVQNHRHKQEQPTELQTYKDAKTPEILPASDSIFSRSVEADIESRSSAILPTYHWRRLFQALHPLGLLALVGSLCFVAWIAKVQYSGEPHIFDASAYVFTAKIYASGHLSVPIPPAIDRFSGPFMVNFAGRWFGQYPPATSLALVPGLLLGVPWLVEPILGTFALLAIGLIAARLFDRRVATLAIILGALSPFYSYLAASYLSHAIALFFLTWGFWALLRFAQNEAGWNLPLATLLFSMAGETRDQVALLYAGIILVGISLLYKRNATGNRRSWIIPSFCALSIIAVFITINICINSTLTHDLWKSPRLLFYPPDHWGFGNGVGFYGQHTLAAGLVNLDELLTILSIDLYGWPFYLTLAFIALPFLTFRATAIDWFLLISDIILTGAYIGYFYHGIYLGPRYLFETLPFLLILTARGILVLAEVSKNGVMVMHIWQSSKKHVVSVRLSAITDRISIPTVMLVSVLVFSNLVYFLPRQIELHRDFSGINYDHNIDLNNIYHPTLPLHNAIVVTSDYFAYQILYFPLNDPYLSGDVLYALASSTADYNELRAAYPGRRLYRIDIAVDGSVHYTPLDT